MTKAKLTRQTVRVRHAVWACIKRLARDGGVSSNHYVAKALEERVKRELKRKR